MEPRKISIKLKRDPRETAERHSQANPLTLECTLATGESVTETMELRAELHAAQTPATTPLAATAAVTMTTGDTGPWDLEFSGAQMNQTVLPDASEDFWLVVYATDADDNLFTLGKIALTLTFDNVSQVTPPPPDPALFLDLGGTKWKVGEDYVVDDIVALDGSIYVCVADNTSAAGDEPGVGAEWESFWVLFSGGGGGGGGTNTIFRALPQDASFPATAFATRDTRNNHPCLDFDSGTPETAYFIFYIPQGASFASLTFKILSTAASATSGVIGWGICLERIVANGIDIDSDNFGAEQTGSTTVNATSGKASEVTITFTLAQLPSGIAAGDQIRIKLTRNTAVGSNHTGDAEFLGLYADMTPEIP